MNNNAVQAMLANNVVELTFTRRHEKLKWNNVRGLLGTTNFKLLNGPFGQQVVHFRPPKGKGMGYNYKAKNLCVVWDFFRQEYRVFGAESVNIRQLFDLNNPEEEESFYNWFNQFIINMSDQQKNKFMGYEGEAFAALQNAKHQQAKQQQEPNQTVVPHRVTSVYNKIKDYIKDYINSFRKKKK
jgi:hypothetical protein